MSGEQISKLLTRGSNEDSSTSAVVKSQGTRLISCFALCDCLQILSGREFFIFGTRHVHFSFLSFFSYTTDNFFMPTIIKQTLLEHICCPHLRDRVRLQVLMLQLLLLQLLQLLPHSMFQRPSVINSAIKSPLLNKKTYFCDFRTNFRSFLRFPSLFRRAFMQ